MSRTSGNALFFKRMLFASFLAIPALASANPIGFDPIAAMPPLLLETFFFAVALRAFGFRSIPVFLIWLAVTSVTWIGLVGFPLGTFAAILAGSAINAEEGKIVFLAGVAGLEMAISVIEALVILLAGRFKFLRRPDTAIIQPGFVKVFQVAILGNLVSMAAGLTEIIESGSGWLCYLAIVPALLLARRITRPWPESDNKAATASPVSAENKEH